MYRLHTLNIMERILYRYEENLERVQDFIQVRVLNVLKFFAKFDS